MIRTVLLLLVLSLASPAFGANCTATSIGLSPVAYTRSAETLLAGMNAASLVQPLDVNGTPSQTGKIGFLKIGNSNARDVGGAFRGMYFLGDPLRNPAVIYVNGAQSGKTAAQWASPADAAWTNAANTAAGAGLSTAQVQWADVTMTQASPLTYGGMTETQVRAIVDNLLVRYPNVRGIVLSGMGYQGYSISNLSLEPYAHNDSVLLAGLVGTLPVFSDFLDSWSDGTTPNPYTGLVWVCGDVKTDGVHPTIGGSYRVGLMQVDRWRIDPVMSWMWKP